MLQPRFLYHKTQLCSSTQARRPLGLRNSSLQNYQPATVEMPAATAVPKQATKRGAPLLPAPVPKKRKAVAAAMSACILTTDPIRQLDTKTVAQLRVELDGMDWTAPRAKKFKHDVPRDQVVLSEDGLKTYFYGSGDLPRAVWPPGDEAPSGNYVRGVRCGL